MSPSASAGTLVVLCAEQHRVTLQFLARLSRAPELDLEQRRLCVQRLRQRLSATFNWSAMSFTRCSGRLWRRIPTAAPKLTGWSSSCGIRSRS